VGDLRGPGGAALDDRIVADRCKPEAGGRVAGMVLAANSSAMEGELEINPAARTGGEDLFRPVPGGALVSMASLTCELAGRRRASRFIGMWPGPLLVMGVYNKLVKLLGPR
jgi:hypothetical protein